MKLAIMGGTFNPIHIGHLVCAEEAVNQYGLDRVVFMPTGVPPHKEMKEGSSSEDRYLMAAIATASNPRFEVSRYEIDKQGTSYTVETIRHFKQETPDLDIYFITGADAVTEILEWKDPAELLRMAMLIAATRPGYPLENISGTTRHFLETNKVQMMEVPAIGVSSSLIRERVAQGQSIRYLVPQGVEQYIGKERLYGQR